MAPVVPGPPVASALPVRAAPPAAGGPPVPAGALFHGLDARGVADVAACLGAHRRRFAAGQVLVRSGDRLSSVGMLLAGRAHTDLERADGAPLLVGRLGPGDVYGEDLLAEPDRRTARTVVADTAGELLQVGMARIVDDPGPLCRLRGAVVENLLRIALLRSGELQRQLEVVGTPSLRARITRYLEGQRRLHGGAAEFSVGWTRQELARHLGADRSALSRELSRMRAAGLIEVHRDRFVLRGAWPG